MDGGWEVEQVVRRVARRSDRSDVVGLVANYTEDAVFSAGGQTVEGRDAIFEFFGGAAVTRREEERTKHIVSNTLVEHDGDEVAATTYWQVLRSWGLANWGRYLDRFRLDGDDWRIAERTVVVDGTIPRPQPASE